MSTSHPRRTPIERDGRSPRELRTEPERLAGRLGVSRVESELDDLAFQVLEPDKYAWVRNMVEAESKQWSTYVERICHILEEEMQKLRRAYRKNFACQ